MAKKDDRTPGTPLWENYAPDIVWDMNGYPMNAKYPPDVKKYGERYNGYPDYKREALFYDFAVQQYDATFTYKGKQYHLGTFVHHVAVCDELYDEEYESYPDANTLIENFEIDGHKLIDIIDELDDVQQV